MSDYEDDADNASGNETAFVFGGFVKHEVCSFPNQCGKIGLVDNYCF